MPLRTAIALAVALLLVRAGRVAWRQRGLAVAVWRALTWRHLLGAVGMLALVVVTAGVLLDLVPGTRLGFGQLLGTAGNAVFAPLEEGLARAGPAPATGTDWWLVGGASLFLGGLLLVLPWLAFVEEELFRAGLERASWPRVVLASVTFGLAHLVMLVPLAAALAIGVAGFGYALAYRRAHRQLRPTPSVALRTYRPPRRAQRALAGQAGPGLREAQAAGVFHAAVWHTAVNSLIVATVWATIVVSALT